jgi:hypothetical protein
MAISWWNRLLESKSRPASRGRRGRPARARLGIEALEAREVPAVTSNIVNGQLQVSSENADIVTLDHAGSFTIVNGESFADAAITRDIAIHVGGFFGGGFNTVNLRATVRSVTVDSPGRLNFLTLGGKPGLGAQGIVAPVSVSGFDGDPFGGFDHTVVTVDDSGNASGRGATLNVVDGVVTLDGLATGTMRFADTGFRRLTLNGGSGGNTFTILDTPHTFLGRPVTTTINSGSGTDTVNVQGASSLILEVEGQSGADSVRLGRFGSLQGIVTDFLDITNARGRSQLTVDDPADVVGRTVLMQTFGGGDASIEGLSQSLIIGYNGFEISSLTINAGSGGNTFNIDDTFKNGSTSSVTTLNTGVGADTVNVRGTTGELRINGQNGLDTVTIGGFPTGTELIRGDVFVTNQASRTALNVSDFRAIPSPAHTVVLDHTGGLTGTGTVSGLASGGTRIRYVNNDVRSVTLTGGSGQDTFFVQSTPVTAGSPVPVTLNGGAGDDIFVVGSLSNTLDAIRGPVTVNGGAGGDILFVKDQGSTTPHTYTQTATAVTRSGGGGPTVTVNFSSIEGLDLSKGPVAGNPPMATDLTLTESVRAGELATLTGRLIDADEADVLSLTVDWGDGSDPDESTPDREPFAVTHAYDAPGTYTVRVIWTDSTGESNFRDLQLTVSSAEDADYLWFLDHDGDGDISFTSDRRAFRTRFGSTIQPCV